MKIRRFMQVGFTVLTNAYYKGFVEGTIYSGDAKALCVPGLNCYSCPGAIGSCPIGAMQAVVGHRNTSFSFYIIGFLMIVGAAFGRFVCGFLCPFGLFQDLLYKIPFIKKLGKLPGDRFMKYFPYVFLVFFVILIPMFVVDSTGLGAPAFCEYICPSGTLMAGWPLVILNEGIRSIVGFLFAWKSAILIALILLSILAFRPFCRYICPLGAVYGLFNPIALYKYKIDGNKCTKCGECKKACEWEIDVYEKPNSRECIRCGDCIRACPEHAIK